MPKFDVNYTEECEYRFTITAKDEKDAERIAEEYVVETVNLPEPKCTGGLEIIEVK